MDVIMSTQQRKFVIFPNRWAGVTTFEPCRLIATVTDSGGIFECTVVATHSYLLANNFALYLF